MKRFSFLLKAAFIFSSIISANVMAASTCSSKQMPVCTLGTDITADAKDSCVSNSNLPAYFKSNPTALPGACSQFSMNKIKTYACNAGLRFLKPSAILCIRYDQNNTVSNSCGDSENCSCTSPNVSNDQNTNYFNFNIADYTGNSVVNFTQKTMDASDTTTYAVASKKSGSEILQDGSALQFNFGSEFYGAEYFVDICIQNKNTNTTRDNLELSGSILFANSVFKNTNYNTASSLYNSVELICTPKSGTATTKTLVSNSIFSNAEKKYANTTNAISSCVIRHYFKENATGKFRENNYKNVTLQTNIALNPEDKTLLLPTPVNFCKVKKVSSNKYTCTNWSSASSEAFIKDLSNSTFFDGDTYTGTCPNPCRTF